MATETIVASADCWANNFPNNVDSNLNTQGLGMGMWAGGLNRSFLKFKLQGISSDLNKLTKAELKLYGSRIHSTAKVLAYFTANDFSETTLTWRNQPPPTILNWNGSGTLMGETSQIPDAASWYTIPIDPVFVKARIGNLYFLVILQGTEEPESYCWAYDKEEAAGAYAPKLVLTTGEAPPLSATLSASPSVGPVPLAVSFTIGIAGGVTPYTWALDYGDGSTPGSGTVAGTKLHTYTNVGTFTATLTVTDALGAATASRSKVMAGVIIQSWVSVLAPLAVGAVLLKMAR